MDAGTDAGTRSGPCSVPDDLGPFIAGRTSVLQFSGCATATFSSEPGVSVVTRPNADGSATVEITPSTLGAWVLTLDANNSMQTRELLTDEQFNFDAGFVRRFPDRVDGARAVTPSGRLITRPNFGQLNVYGFDGGLEQTIAADPYDLALAGDSVWTLRPDVSLVERWVDTPAGLTSGGSADVSGYSYCLFCRVDQNQTSTMIGYDLVEFTWDGGSASRQVMNAGLVLGKRVELLLRDGPDKVWSDDFCSYEPGCTTTVCPPIRTCLSFVSSIISVTPQNALVYNGSQKVIQLWSLPLSQAIELHARPGQPLGISTSSDAPTLVSTSADTTSEVVIHRNRILYRHFGQQTDSPLIVTKRWVVRLISPREAQFIPR